MHIEYYEEKQSKKNRSLKTEKAASIASSVEKNLRALPYKKNYLINYFT